MGSENPDIITSLRCAISITIGNLKNDEGRKRK